MAYHTCVWPCGPVVPGFCVGTHALEACFAGVGGGGGGGGGDT